MTHNTPRVRLTSPLIRNGREFYGPDTLGVFSCSKSPNEMHCLASEFPRVVFGTHNIDSCNRT